MYIVQAQGKKISQPIVRYRKENLRKQIATASRPTRGHASRLDRADLSNRQNFWGLHNGIKVILKSYFIFITNISNFTTFFQFLTYSRLAV